MTTPNATSLTPGQQQRVDRAREVLTGPAVYELTAMAARIGALEWHLGEVLALVDELAAAAR